MRKRIIRSIFIPITLFTIVFLITIGLLTFLAPLSINSEDFDVPWGPTERYVNEMYATIPLNFSEVKNIDIYEAEKNLNESGIIFKNRSGIEDDIDYLIYQDTDSYELVSWISGDENKAVGWMTITYSETFSESELEEKKEFLSSKILQIAEICNITVDLDDIDWNLQYAD